MITFRINDNVLKKVNHGDGEKIAKISGISKGTINKAFRDKRATEKTLKAINNYFNNNN